MQRRGAVLSLLLHLKQICNHPDQYLGTEEYSPSQSGKFEMLRQLAQTIAEKRERVLVFTQFRELTAYLDDFLAEVFGRRGGVIHGGVPVKERNEQRRADKSAALGGVNYGAILERNELSAADRGRIEGKRLKYAKESGVERADDAPGYHSIPSDCQKLVGKILVR